MSETAAARIEVSEVSRLELFFDLVFVFTITQFTGVLEHHPSLTGVAQATVMLAIVWWMYGGYAWLTNLVPPDRPGRRVAMVCGMVSYLVLALAIPRAFEGEGLAFGLAYLLVVLVHGGLFTVSTEASLSMIYRGFFPVNVSFALIVIAGGALGGDWQYAFWAAAATAAWISPRLIPDQSHLIHAHHFVERHALVALVAIGESVVAVGIGASGSGLDAGTLVTIALGMVVTAGLWWAYFGEADDELREAGFVAAVAEGRYLVAVRAFGLAFAALLGGVVMVAAGLRHAIAQPSHDLSGAQALYLGGGVGLFLVADQISRMWMTLRVSKLRLVVAALAVATATVGTTVSGGAQELVLAAVLLAGFVAESRPGRRHTASGARARSSNP
jgi:low temperature requirement protein LtrA